MNLDTLLTALYAIVAHFYRQRLAPQLPPRPGRKPGLADG